MPAPGERFFIDTNVWLQVFYPPATARQFGPNAPGPAYADFLEACLNNGAELLWSTLSFSEVASAVEKIECEIYNRINGAVSPLDRKSFRAITVERSRVVHEVESIWGLIASVGLSIPTPCEPDALDEIRRIFGETLLDGYDSYFVHAMNQRGVKAVVTDDVDYLSVSGLAVFTANSRALAEASDARKLAIQ